MEIIIYLPFLSFRESIATEKFFPMVSKISRRSAARNDNQSRLNKNAAGLTCGEKIKGVIKNHFFWQQARFEEACSGMNPRTPI
jgi:hypothetical protein